MFSKSARVVLVDRGAWFPPGFARIIIASVV
jgi:hypothetical protein